MRAILSTGGARDFIQLTAESVEECSDLARIATSTFIQPDKVVLVLGPMRDMELRIWVSEPRLDKLSDAMRDAIDQTP